MMPFVFVLIALSAGYFTYRFWRRKQTHRALLSTVLTDHQRGIVAQHVPFFHRLPTHLHVPVEGKINAFLEQVDFIGCDGLDVTEEMRLSIAAQACLLIANSETWYDHLTTVLIYPGAFKSMRQKREGYVVTESETVRLGESWSRGPVILSWADTERGALDDRDGHNVALHEFAHQIDGLSGHTDGAPILSKGQSLATWAHVIMTAFERHVGRVHNGQKTVIDAYGAQAPEEFFAVAVELFFERPQALKQDEPAFYQQLVDLFKLDPATWR